VHVFAAIIWVGGAFFLQVKIAQFQRANDNEGFLQVGKDAETMLRVADALEDLDDVQNVHANFDISEEEMARLA